MTSEKEYILSIDFQTIDGLSYDKELWIPQMFIKFKQNVKALRLLIDSNEDLQIPILVLWGCILEQEAIFDYLHCNPENHEDKEKEVKAYISDGWNPTSSEDKKIKETAKQGASIKSRNAFMNKVLTTYLKRMLDYNNEYYDDKYPIPSVIDLYNQAKHFNFDLLNREGKLRITNDEVIHLVYLIYKYIFRQIEFKK